MRKATQILASKPWSSHWAIWTPSANLRVRRALMQTRLTSSMTDHRENNSLEGPEGSSHSHHDLPSFLAYAKRNGLSTSSTVYVGTHYEYTIAAGLVPLGFQLKRVGGASDFGIDLLGSWEPPSTSISLKVLAQCKAGTQQARPRMIRELEGAFIGAPPGWRGGVLGLLVTEQAATKGIIDSLRRSRWPMGFVRCSSECRISQLLWNQKASELGLEGFEVGLRHTAEDTEITLRYNGKQLPYIPR